MGQAWLSHGDSFLPSPEAPLHTLVLENCLHVKAQVYNVQNIPRQLHVHLAYYNISGGDLGARS